LSWNYQGKRKKERQTQEILNAERGIGDQEDKEELERSVENSFGQEGLERCNCGPICLQGTKR
jgi:hypothetical protein